MSDRADLLDAFARGALVRPSVDQMCFVDVVRAVQHAAGVDCELNEHARDVRAHLRGAEHIVFLLADGMGIDLVDRLPRNSWIRRHTGRAILAPFPSTTTTAVTSFATGAHTAEHAVSGWWVHIPRVEGPATVFAHDRAHDGRSLSDLGLGVDAICHLPPMLSEMSSDAMLLVPTGIVDSPFTAHMSGGRTRRGYRTYGDALNTIVERVQQAEGPTFTYWYTPSPDSEAHDEGSTGERVFHAVEALSATLETLAERLTDVGRPWRLVGTADHGHLELSPHLELAPGDALLEHLRFPPSGDMRVQFWHVRDGSGERFTSAFRSRFSESFYLLSAETAEELELFGPGRWSEQMRQRSGDFVSISKGRASLRYAGIPGSNGYRRMRSGHSGLSPAEMRVPLIIGGEASSELAFDP
ncbi:MAG: alkaline phosphatase family protein [Dehalococcoidia bacterium]